MGYIQELETILAPPAEPAETGSFEEWTDVYKNIKGLPTDYFDFINKYGTGSINNFIWVLNPFSLNHYLNLLNRLPVIVNAFSVDCSEEISNKYNFYPAAGGLIPLAITDNGDSILYYKNEFSGAEKIVIIDGRANYVSEFDMGFTEFLFKLCNNQITQDILPSEVFIENCSFQKYSN